MPERDFPVEDVFFSTTDRKGRIRACNPVFVRVSGFPAEELLGVAHNRVRHPDMPRAVFRLFWETLQAGRPIASYVCNRTKDGAHYWVMATAVPIADGYLSLRCKPSSEHLAQARAIYARLRALEREVEGDDPRRRKASIEASAALLGELLAEAGYESYDAFMHVALPAEVTAREAQLGSTVRQRLGRAPAGADPALAAVLEHCAATHDVLDGLVANLEDYAALNTTLEGRSRFVLELADRIRLFSLNALLAAARLGADGAALGAVAGLMRGRSDAADPVIRELHEEIVAAVELLGDMGFRIAVSRLQAEMLMSFVQDVMAGHGAETAGAQLAPLAGCLRDGTDRLLSSLAGLDERLRGVVAHAGALTGDLDALRALEVNGRIEAARASDTGAVRDLFATIGEQVRVAREEMGGFDGVRRIAAGRDAAGEREVRGHVDAVCARVSALAA